MVKLLTIFTIVLALVLFPPAALALISNNAVPGDSTYPIKRTLEDGIYAVASITPITKAWFAAARSDRRFKEFSALISQGKTASNTLNELVTQTDTAAEEIGKIDDPIKKQQLADQLLDSIKKYDQGLKQASNQITTKELAANPATVPVQQPAGGNPTPTTIPTVKATPTPTQAPSSSVAPTSTPVSTPQSTPAPTPFTEHPNQPTDIEKAREDLDKIKDKLKITNKKTSEQEKNGNEVNFLLRNKEEKKENKGSEKDNNSSNKSFSSEKDKNK